MAIQSFAHKGLEAFFRTSSKAGIQPRHAPKLSMILALLDSAACPLDVDAPGLHLHALTGNLAGYWAVTVQANWRVIFGFGDRGAELVDYLDYH